jgi:hypothetical protein
LTGARLCNIAQRLQRHVTGHRDPSRLLKARPVRLRNQLARTSDGIFGKRSATGTEHGVSWCQIADTRANCFDDAGVEASYLLCWTPTPGLMHPSEGSHKDEGEFEFGLRVILDGLKEAPIPRVIRDADQIEVEVLGPRHRVTKQEAETADALLDLIF